jgi:beta-lactam-binding protein with PASTA domain
MVVGVLLLIVLVLGFFASLGWITGHNQYERVPDIVGQNIFTAKTALEAKGFRVVVTDSVFTTEVPGLTVTKQIPASDATVKSGRTIYLSINRAVPPLIDMPSLVGYSYKSAELFLQSMGLKMGDTTYRADFARNAVLEQLFQNAVIKPGTKIPLGSTINIILGSGMGSTEFDVPDLVGLTLSQAKSLLASMGISTGSLVVVGSVSDSLNAFIVKQLPEPITEIIPGEKTSNKIRAGATMDIYISTTAPIKDTTKIY